MMLLISLLLFLPKIVCGFALVHWLWDELDISSVLIKAALGFAVSLALSSSLFFLAILIGIPPNFYSLVEFWGLLIVAILLLPRFVSRWKDYWRFSSLSRQDYLSLAVLISGFALLVYAFLYYSNMHPYGFEDAWSIWNYTARFIYRTNSPTMLFDQQLYDRFHPDYPIGLSLNVAWGWFVLHRESTSVPIAIAFYIITSPALILWGVLKKWRGTLPALLGTLVYLMNPNLKWSVGQMADGLISLYMLSAAIMLYVYLRSSNPGVLLIAGLLAGFSAWIKNEGMLFMCVFLLIQAIMMLKRVVKWDTIKWLALGLLFPVLMIALYKIAIDVPSDIFSSNNSFTVQILSFPRWWAIGREFGVNIVNYGNWPVSMVLILLVYMILVGIDKAEHQRQIWTLLLILGQLAGYFIVYLITPYDLDWHLTTSIDRVVSHLFPLLYFWIFVSTRSPNLAATDSSYV